MKGQPLDVVVGLLFSIVRFNSSYVVVVFISLKFGW